MRKVIIPAAAALALLSGCGDSPNSRAKAAVAKAMTTAADNCLYDVRDHNISFSRSASCSSLDALADQYLKDTTSDDLENPDFQAARLSAWMALAISNGTFRNEPPVIRIW